MRLILYQIGTTNCFGGYHSISKKKAGGSYEQKDIIFYNNQFIHNNNFINYFTF